MFRFKSFSGPEQHIPAMREVKKIVKNAEFISREDSKIFTWAFAFASWETDEVMALYFSPCIHLRLYKAKSVAWKYQRLVCIISR